MTTGNYDRHSLDPGVSEYITSIIAENFIKLLLKIVAEKTCHLKIVLGRQLPTGSKLSKTIYAAMNFRFLHINPECLNEEKRHRVNKIYNRNIIRSLNKKIVWSFAENQKYLLEINFIMFKGVT